MALSVHPLPPTSTTADPSVLWQDGERVLRRPSRLGGAAERQALRVGPSRGDRFVFPAPTGTE